MTMNTPVPPSRFVFTHFFVLLGAIGLSLILGERFFFILFLQFLLCKTIEGLKNPSLSATLILGAVVLAELSTLITLIPIVWSSLPQLVYLFLAHAYLGHYFVWCIRLFELIDQESETRLCFTFSWTCFLSGLLPSQGYLSRTVFVGGVKPSTSLILTLVCGCSVLLNNRLMTELIRHRLDSIVWIIPQTILFIAHLSTHLIDCHSHHYTDLVRLILQLLFGALFFVSYLIPLESSFGIFSAVGYRRFLSRTPLTLGFSALCSVVALLAYGRSERDLFEASLVFCLYAFHYVEWQLYEAMVIPPLHLLCSSFLFGFCAFVLYVCSQSCTNTTSTTKQPSRRPTVHLFSWSVMRLSVLVPALTKFTLLCWNHTDWFGLGADSSVGHVVSRVRFERSAIVGLFLIYLGLLMGARLFRIALKCAAAGCASLASLPRIQTKQVRNLLAFVLFVAYFSLALCCIWSPLIRSKFGVVPNNYVLVWPLAVLLSSVSISGLSRDKTVFHIDPNQLRVQTARGVEASIAFLWFVALSGRIMDCRMIVLCSCALFAFGLFLLLHLLALIVPAQGSDSTGVQYRFPASAWVSLSIRVGIFIGFVLLTFVLWVSWQLFQGATQLSDGLILAVIGFSICLAALIVLRSESNHSVRDPVSTAQQYAREQNGIEVVNLPAESPPFNGKPSGPNCNTKLPLFVSSPKAFEMARSVTRLRIVLLLLGFTFLCLIWMVHQPTEASNSERSLLAVLAISMFVLGQMTVGCPRFIKLLTPNNEEAPPSDWFLQYNCGCSRLLTCLVNASVLAVILCLYFSFLWTHSDIEVLFLPCFLFGLTGRWICRHRLFAPLLGFTAVLLCSAWWQSHLYHSSHPPLPTFNRTVFRVSYSKWRMGIETALTVLLLPVHGLFLADQADCTTEQLLSLLVPRRLLIASSHADKDSTFCSLCTWLRAAHLLSQFCAVTLCAIHVLTLACLAYILVASSFASALYGLYSFGVCIYILVRVDVITDA
ncbi:hypothetical protein FGIG_00866 [Fasciola gigantica]|uniref:Uncharacterized protein n=1 Tax=Fasciola gigantica TaxID=46835 RepID=A0A504WVG3_FASGI|nr:hypothetical protein FGIG_00866 [Fasciola gigantica]